MKVKFICAIASENWAHRPGEVVELDDTIAKAWIAAGTCMAAEDDEPKVINPTQKAKKQ